MKRILSMILVLSLFITTANLSEIAAFAETEPVSADSTLSEENEGLYKKIMENPTAGLFGVGESFAFSSLRGKVVDEDGNPVAGVSVQLYNKDESACLTLLSTGANGIWASSEYEVIEGYTYIVRYYKAGYTFSDNNIEYVAQSGGTTVDDAVASKIEMENLVCNEDDYEYRIDDKKAIITKYNGEDNHILLPSELGGYSVASVDSDVFFGNLNLKTVCFSENITKIGARAFYECSNLENVYLPNYLTEIEWNAFYNCSKLETIDLPIGLNKIETRAFYGCTGFSEITLPDTVTNIESRAFENCTNLSSINFPLSWTYAGDHIFNGCVSLTEMVVPEGVTQIPSYVFYGAEQLTNIELPSTLKTIGSYAFYECTGLTDIELPDGLNKIDSHAFYGCTGFSEITLPDTVTNIEDHAFGNCENLSSINFPLNWKYADSNIFKGCVNLTEITVPENVAEIPSFAFFGAENLTSITFPSTLREIGSYAFYECTGLTDISLPDEFITIGSYAFYECTGLTDIELPDGLNKIDSHAFYGCTGFSEITLPDTVTNIKDQAFGNCENLSSINFPLSWKYADNNIFKGCINLTEMVVPEGVTKIPNYAFFGAENFERITLPSTLTEIGGYAFYECTGLSGITLPEGLTKIDGYAFCGCEGFSEIKLPDSLVTIESGVFSGCENLSSVNIPLSWTRADNNIFRDCEKLTSITVPEGMTKLPDNAFFGANYLKTVNLPSTLTVIGAYSFMDCGSFVQFTVPEGVTSIKSWAFANCEKLERIWIGENVSEIDDNAFNGCEKLRIHGVSGSYAESYANEKGFEFSTEILTYDFATLGGQIKDSEENTVENVSVSIYNKTKGEFANKECVTDSDGYWSIDDAEIGNTYQIRYYKGGYSFDNNNITVTVENSTVNIPEVVATEIDAENLVCNEDDYEYRIDDEKAIITKYNGEDSHILLPSELGGYRVVTVDSDVFFGKLNLTTVCFSENITKIGARAFYECLNLENVYLPNYLTEIEWNAFYNCSKLETIDLPIGLTKIETHAFHGCTGFSEITLPDTVTEIDSCAFENCSSLESVNYPLNLKYTGNDIFKGCVSLTEMVVPEGVTQIPSYAFYGAENLTNITLPSTLTEIGSYAFYECTGITDIELPDGLNKIDSHAFYGCTGFSEITLPDTVTNIEDQAFGNCENLGSINFPLSWKYADNNIFKGCINLTEMVVPEGVTKIPNYAFFGAENFKSIALPSTLTEIGGYAFYECTGLSGITLPEGLTKIDGYAFCGCEGFSEIKLPDSLATIESGVFSGCENLSSVNIPLNWTRADNNIFRDCKKLTSITVPEGMTKLPDNAFFGANYLKTVNLPSTLTVIGAYSFMDCGNMYYLVVPKGVTRIRNYAFANCEKLRLLCVLGNRIDMEDHIFEGSEKLTVECEEFSFVTVYCINQGIPVQFIGSNYVDSDEYVLSRDNTYYVANTRGAMANGYITMNIGYDYKDAISSQITNQYLSIYMPDGMSMIAKTLKLDGVLVTDIEEYEENVVRIPLTNKSGSISFCLKPIGDAKLTTYAIMEFRQNGTLKNEVLGIINEDIPIITISSRDTVDSEKVSVSGAGPRDSDIELYIDGVFAKKVRSNMTGSYLTDIEITEPKDYTTYTISAKATDENGKPISASKQVVYSSGAPSLKNFNLTYEDHDGKHTYDLSKNKDNIPTIIFDPSRGFKYEVKFNNTQNVDEVYVCSTRNNVTKRIKAAWNEKTQSYTASGLFDSSNSSYVPGALSVEYTTVKDKLSFANGIDYSSAKYVNGASEPIKAVLRSKLDDCIKDLKSDDKTLSGIIQAVDINSQIDFNIMTDIIPSYLDPSNAGKYGYEVYEDDYGAKLYLKVAEYGEDKVRGEIVDFAHEKVSSFLIEGKHLNAASNVDSYFNFMEALGYVDTMITWDNNRINLNEARDSVLASSMSEAQKAAALEKIENARTSNHAVVACMALGLIFTAAGIAIPFPCSMILPLLSMQHTSYINDILGEFGYLKGTETEDFLLKLIIDPSGYVYDALTNERLEDVSTTAYWIAYDPENESFWDEVPADDEYGTEWNAEEWGQINPIITGTDGKYAWNVPEGWWRVKYEKDGYETQWSDWMTVPPVQTDVNIAMVPLMVPDKYISYDSGEKKVTIVSDEAFEDAQIIVSALKGNKLLCVKMQTADITKGDNSITINNLETQDADLIRVMVWKSSGMKPIVKKCSIIQE